MSVSLNGAQIVSKLCAKKMTGVSTWPNNIACSGTCPFDKLSFGSAEELEEHFHLQHHKALTEAQIPLLAKKSSTFKALVVDACPICGKVEAAKDSRTEQAQRAIQGLQSHLQLRKRGDFNIVSHIG